jgi:hypothetical protein
VTSPSPRPPTDRAVTERVFRTGVEDPGPGSANPRVSGAYAREASSKNPVTEGDHGGGRRRVATAAAAARSALAGWWVWTARPLSLRAAWRLSGADPRRLPPHAPWWLVELWRLSNLLDRRAWFVLMMLAPSGLQGPLRWLAVRPTRRLGTYIVVAALSAVSTVVKGN